MHEGWIWTVTCVKRVHRRDKRRYCAFTTANMYASLPPLYNVCCLFASAWLHVTHLIMINSVSKDREDGSTLLLTVGHNSKIRHCRRVFSVLPPRDTGTQCEAMLFTALGNSVTLAHTVRSMLFTALDNSVTLAHTVRNILFTALGNSVTLAHTVRSMLFTALGNSVTLAHTVRNLLFTALGNSVTLAQAGAKHALYSTWQLSDTGTHSAEHALYSTWQLSDTGTHSAEHALYSTWQLSDTGTHSTENALYSTWQLSDTGTHSVEHALYSTWEGEEGCLGGALVKICINSSSFRNQRDSVEVGFSSSSSFFVALKQTWVSRWKVPFGTKKCTKCKHNVQK